MQLGEDGYSGGSGGSGGGGGGGGGVRHFLLLQEAEAKGKVRLERSENRFDNVLALVFHYSRNRYGCMYVHSTVNSGYRVR